MDFHLKQWRNQNDDESDIQQQQQQVSVAKMPKLLSDHHHHHHQQQQQNDSYTALPLFTPEPNSAKLSNLSAFPDHSRFPRMGSYFSLAQIQELELQAMIYRYMREGVSVPPELLQPIKKSLLYSTPYFLHPSLSHYSYCQPTLFQTGYWGRGAMDPEPGRCRRTDGKKWRCSRDVVAGQKYCERHVHRGRNRSRKPVEIPTPSPTTTSTATGFSTGSGSGGVAAGSMFNSSSTAGSTTGSALAAVVNGTSISLSRQSNDSIDLLHLNHSCSDSKAESKGLRGPIPNDQVGDKPDGHVLRHFFDDWPRSLQEPDSNAGSNPSPLSSATCLSISMPGNSSSDVSLKLSMGNGDDESAGDRGGNERELPMLNWGGSGWGTNQVSSMGGPLAEALRSSVSNSSPTSVLHQLPRGSGSEASYVST